MTFKIGRIDSGFRLSHNDFLQDINEASGIWEKAIGKNLFEYDADGELTINLIYDDRQKVVELRNDIGDGNRVAQSVKEEYQSKLDLLKIEEEKYKVILAEYNLKISKYNADVEYWNTKGGAPKNEYSQLPARKRALDIEKQQLDVIRLNLTKMSSDIKVYVDKYNLLVDNINNKVEVVNSNAGEIEEGLYTSKTNTIDIYQYESQTKLIRVLAHELGHSLGIDHNDNRESIMYKINDGNKKTLSVEDMTDLKRVCRVK
jgi:predicted Zn-dependent protease